MTKEDILNLIKSDPWMMNIIQTAEKLNLKDWLIGAGFVRNKVWDYLSGYKKDIVDTADIDLVYFDPQGNDWLADNKISLELKQMTGITWEVRNQFYMHEKNNLEPYKSTEDAISKWVETATAIGVTMKNGELELVAPHGIDDLVNLIVRPTPTFVDKIDVVKKRVNDKKWQSKWPKLKLVSELL